MSQSPVPLVYTQGASPLPPQIFPGASSWTHEFWKGQIYHREYKSAKDFNLNSLKEYADFGLFRAVEIDSTFYTPPKEETLAGYATLVPDNFKFTAKVWERISIPVYPNIKRYGKYAGCENDSFLSPDVFNQEFLPPFRNPQFSPKLGCFLIQFPKMDPDFAGSRLFLQKLENFLSFFPENFRLAIEIRNRELLKPDYIRLINRFRVTHCFNQWESMYSLLEQMKKIAETESLAAGFYYIRLITPPRVSFNAAGKMFEPFYEIKRRDEETRKNVLRIARRAVEKDCPVFIIVNNRFEGNTPRTISELQSLLTSGT